MRWLVALLASAAIACSHRPARFADRPAVTELGDDRPIALPKAIDWIEPVHLSELYLKRPLLELLDAERIPYARDVNALDEVPRSSFWDPPPLEPPSAFERAYARPALGEISIEDPPHLPGTRSAAAVIASRLVRAVGYKTPELRWSSERSAAALWPPGIELGPTDPIETRSDDPNDQIAHRDRRTLRALGVLAAWIDLPDLGPSHVVDVYVGAPPRGHVQHFVVGLDQALGVAALGAGGSDETAAGVVRGSLLENLYTLGLKRPKPRVASQRSLRALSPSVGPEFRLAHPWAPADRLLPSDGYWMAKRIARIPGPLLKQSVLAARLDPALSRHLVDALEARRAQLIGRWLDTVTPLELVRCESDRLVLVDEAIRLRFTNDAGTRYRVAFIDDQAAAIGRAVTVRPASGQLELALPLAALARDYFVVRITGVRAGRPLPRPCEVHISTRAGPHVVGVRH
jgi:hypothetical protein